MNIPNIPDITNNQFNQVNDLNEINFIRNYKSGFIQDNYNNIINDINNNKLSHIYIDNEYKQIITVFNSNTEKLADFHISNINQIIVPKLIDKAIEHNIKLDFINFTNPNYFFEIIKYIFDGVINFAIYSIPIYIIFIITINIFKNIQNNNNYSNYISNDNINNNPFMPNNLFNKKPFINFIKPNISLNSWMGTPEIIEEIAEVINYIENKEKFNNIGAEMPKGILLEGPPGTGKTLLAKAIATETNSSFFAISSSEFIELFVGVGALRVRELFENARENKPSIIFIDEIDAIGKQRGSNINGANDEREQTLNQLLSEMDGFKNNDGIIIIAATNRKDMLDKALLRPGRFDRIIKVPLPDKDSREKILNFYVSNKKIDKNIDISLLAELTEGLSGAELKNVINEAAIITVRNNESIIQENSIYDAFEKSIIGIVKKNYTTNINIKTRVSIHESGHSLLALNYDKYFDFRKVSINPTYNGAGGYTIFTIKPEHKQNGLYTKDLLKKKLIVTLAGKAAEYIYYGNDYISCGAIMDLREANKLAEKMIGHFGMGDKLEVFFNEEIRDNNNDNIVNKYSEYTKRIIDSETLILVNDAYNEAKTYLEKNKNKLYEFSKLLSNSTILYKKDIPDKFFGTTKVLKEKNELLQILQENNKSINKYSKNILTKDYSEL